MAVQIELDTLPGIETVMTNFNQIVIREAQIKKYLFCFDLPITQLKQESKMLKVP